MVNWTSTNGILAICAIVIGGAGLIYGSKMLLDRNSTNEEVGDRNSVSSVMSDATTVDLNRGGGKNSRRRGGKHNNKTKNKKYKKS
jgi:hypothetical protein